MKAMISKVSRVCNIVLQVVTGLFPGVSIYEVMDDELLEDDDLVIPGETSLDDSAATESDSSQEDVPVRLLQDFTIYDMSTNEAVPVGELMYLKYVDKVFGASGLAKPWVENDVDEGDESDTDSDDNAVGSNFSERVKLSKLLEFDIHHYSEVSKSLDRFVDPRRLCTYTLKKDEPDLECPDTQQNLHPYQICLVHSAFPVN
jgi:DNA (cytosine-5)-methyltransferase 1